MSINSVWHTILNRFSSRQRNQLEQAVDCYIQRRSHHQNPNGHVSSDGFWHPESVYEMRPCCLETEQPSAERPLILLRHCTSAEHIGALHDTSPDDILAVVFLINDILGGTDWLAGIPPELFGDTESSSPLLHGESHPAQLPFEDANQDEDADEDEIDRLMADIDKAIRG